MTSGTKVTAVTQVTRQRTFGAHPQYRVTFADGTDALTKPDAQVNYGISNSEYREGEVEVSFDGNLIVGIKRTDGSAITGNI